MISASLASPSMNSSARAAISGSSAVTRAAADSKSIPPGCAVSSFLFFRPHVRFLLFFFLWRFLFRRFELRSKIRDRRCAGSDRPLQLLDFFLYLIDTRVRLDQLIEVAGSLVQSFSV